MKFNISSSQRVRRANVAEKLPTLVRFLGNKMLFHNFERAIVALAKACKTQLIPSNNVQNRFIKSLPLLGP
jgi:hypothetical protein